ncbi:MAG: argininosuccinate lyase [Desulfobulbaceae bacterium A2]|nr:MAG: argininosuccinate lyase [Desulfobulbaceae bacterium A2]
MHVDSQPAPTPPVKMWGGRFAAATAASVEAFTASVHYDARLAACDIAGSRVHARMLGRQGLLNEGEVDAILRGLDDIAQEITAGTFVFRPELEDVHMNIEKALSERIGAAGEKLHTARSRNDQVALDLRLYLRDECDRLAGLLQDLRRALAVLARRYLGTVMPGYTHMQRAQPVLLSHHLLAYVEMFGRDRGRLSDCRARMNFLPLGAAALAGTGLPIDRDWVAAELGFAGVSANSMDTVGDRDFACEFLFAGSMIQLHLSRLAEELVLWSGQEFGFVEIDDRYCTGSSIMPQKKNPDIAELVRGKSGRTCGNLLSLLMVLKGLPLTYNRDLQEDKEPVFDTVDTVGSSLAIMAEMMAQVHFRGERLTRAAEGGFMTATDLADYLVRQGLPFRQAHAVVGRIVARCQEQGVELAEAPLALLQEFSPQIGEDVRPLLTVEGSIASRVSSGGTARARVEEALRRLEHELGV